ncbi:MAG TPA: TonB-dependent receptor [Sphingomonas sp.]|nr:TonB-dependent receptor [Sphingomonas sp.]
MSSKLRLTFRTCLLSSTLLGVQPALAQAQVASESADDTTGGQIIVTGRRAADRAALEAKREAAGQISQVRADDVGRLPDQNVAETLRRLPGLSVANDQGEGRYLTVRGVSPDLLNVTLNGQTAAAPEPDARQVKLDDIPSGLIGAVTVVKTLTPDLDANAIAGSANIETVTAFDRRKTFLTATGAVGYNRLGKTHPVEGDISFGTLFGPDKQFGVVLAANYSKRTIESQNAQSGGHWDVVNGFDVPLESTLRQYHIVRERTGLVANFDWRPTDAVRTYVRMLYSKFSDREDRFGFSVEPDDDTIVDQTATSGRFGDAEAVRDLKFRREDTSSFSTTVGGDFDIGESLLTIEAGYTRATKRDPHRTEWSFETDGFGGSYDTTGIFPRYSVGDVAYDAANFGFDEVDYENRHAVEDLYQGRIDYRTPIGIGDDSTIKLGVKATQRNKTNNEDVDVYDGFDGDLALTEVQGRPVGSIFSGRYVVGPKIDPATADGFFDQNSDWFELDAEGTIGDSLAADYRIKERILAAYVMTTLKFGDFTAIPGVRVENTKSKYAAKAVIDTLVLDDIDKDYDNFGAQSYTDWFPGINLRYDVGDHLVLRGAVTRAIGRPNYEQLAPTIIVNISDNEVEMGNPTLSPLTSTNFDLSAEYYIGRGGILSIAAFYKSIANPIYSTTIVESGTFAGRDLTDAQVTTPVNADSAKVKGIELNAQVELDFLPSPLDGLTAGGSMTFVDSEAKGVPGRPGEHLPLASQSDRVGSAFLSYEKSGFSARVAYTYRSAYLLEPGESTYNDIYVGSFNQWDAKIGYEVSKNIKVFFEGSNLNDEPNLMYQGIRRRVDELERYGYSFRAGMQLSF